MLKEQDHRKATRKVKLVCDVCNWHRWINQRAMHKYQECPECAKNKSKNDQIISRIRESGINAIVILDGNELEIVPKDSPKVIEVDFKEELKPQEQKKLGRPKKSK